MLSPHLFSRRIRTYALIVSFPCLSGILQAQPEVARIDLLAPNGIFSGDSSSNSSVWGINNSGQVLVTGNDASGTWRAYVWTTAGVTEIVNTLPDANGMVVPSGINDSGQVVGSVNSDAAFVWSSGSMSPIENTINTAQNFPNAINQSGQVVGDLAHWSGTTLYRWEAGNMTVLSPLNESYATATAINNVNQVSGTVYDSGTGNYQAIRWESNGSATVITPPDAGAGSAAYDMNDSGHVVGSFFDPDTFGTEHAMVWDGTGAIDIGNLLDSPFQSSVAQGINDLGQVVGRGYGAFLYEDGVLYDLTDLAAIFLVEEGTSSGFVSLDIAYDINNLGQIIGTGMYYDSVTDRTYEMGYMVSLKAVPEPSTYAMIGGWMILGASFRRFYRK